MKTACIALKGNDVITTKDIRKYYKIMRDLKERLKPSRYEHTLGVTDTALRLAGIHGCEIEKAGYAGLLHDCAKYMSNDRKIELCKKYGVAISDAERKNPDLLHAKCGAVLAKQRYEVTDTDILHAVAVHTTGAPGMGLLDKILFVSDYIEPRRSVAPHLDELRALAETDLDKTVYRILKDTVDYLNTRKDRFTDPATADAYAFYKNMCKGVS